MSVERARGVNLPLLIATALGLAGLYVAVFAPGTLSVQEARAGGLVIVCIGLWSTGVLPEFITALGFFLLAMLFAVAPAPVVFSGFASTALWLVFGGLVIGVAVKNTGLGARIARSVALRLNGSYPRLIGGVVFAGVLLGFIMPSSMGRIILFVPIALALAEYFGFERGSNGRLGLVLAAAFGAHVPTFAILPANVPNMVLVGAAETLYGISPQYGEYLWLHFPVLGLLKSLLIIALIVFLFPDQPRARTDEHTAAGPMTGAERRLALILALTLALWMTDFVHHVSPAWIALAAGLVLLLPGIGLVDGEAFNRDLSYGSLFFVAGVLGLGALVAHSGLGDHLAKGLLHTLPLAPGESLVNFFSLVLSALLTSIATTLPGAPAVLTPLAADLSRASGLPVETVLMTQVLGFSTALFPYQAPAMIVAMQMAGERVAPALKLVFVLGVTTVLVLLPIDYVWWRLLGWI